MLIASVVLLIIGFVVRSAMRATAPARRPFWNARQMFQSRRAYVTYVAGTLAIVSGAGLLVFSLLARTP